MVRASYGGSLGEFEAAAASTRKLNHWPCPGHLPIAHHALGRDIQHFRRPLDAEAVALAIEDQYGCAPG